jgi:hypothetical protein
MPLRSTRAATASSTDDTPEGQTLPQSATRTPTHAQVPAGSAGGGTVPATPVLPADPDAAPAAANGDNAAVLAAIAAFQTQMSTELREVKDRCAAVETKYNEIAAVPVAPAHDAGQQAQDAGNAPSGATDGAARSKSQQRTQPEPSLFGDGDGKSDEESDGEFETDHFRAPSAASLFPRPHWVDPNAAPHRFDPEQNETFRALNGASAKEFSVLYSALSYLHDLHATLQALYDETGSSEVRDLASAAAGIMDVLGARHDYIALKLTYGDTTASAIYDATDAPGVGKLTSSSMRKGLREYLRKSTTAQVNKAAKLGGDKSERRRDRDGNNGSGRSGKPASTDKPKATR